jgi:hypothetical protein
MIAFNDTIYIFTKNWGNQRTNIYAIPNSIGNHSVSKIDSLNPQGLMTGATYDSTSQSLVLCGYQTAPFIYTSVGLMPPHFSTNSFKKSNLTVQNSFQIEGVVSIGSNYYFSAEQNLLGLATLYRLGNANSLKVDKNESTRLKIYPNPCSDYLIIETDVEYFEVLIYDAIGKLVLKSINRNQINCYDLSRGVYIVQCLNGDGGVVFLSQKITLI